ncbi:hypothetical protein DMJ13_24535 [halophilic archaeon]|nr:hypothetical protein DMJ13_24535 [halophilic archaeon]
MSYQDCGHDSDGAYEYECLHCGTIATATNHPGSCPDCGEAVRNRGMPCE